MIRCLHIFEPSIPRSRGVVIEKGLEIRLKDPLATGHQAMVPKPKLMTKRYYNIATLPMSMRLPKLR